MIIKRITLFLKLLLVCLTLLLTSCLEVKQTININRDGSGDARLEIGMLKEYGTETIQKIKQKIKEDMSKWNIVEEKEKEGKHIIVLSRKFKEISELNDDEAKYSFSSEKIGFLKKSYILEITQLRSSEMSLPYEIFVKVPGSIDETNGTKISSNEVKWNLQGLRRGKELSVKSSGFVMPHFASLKESFNKTLDSLFYREAIVFLRDGNLWVMDSDGKNQKQLTKEGVGSWSVSRDGKIVYSYKDNCYIFSSVNEVPERLVDANGCSSPVISSDGSKIAFVKVDEKFSEAQQKIIPKHKIPFYIKEGTPKKTGIYIIDLKLRQQKRVVGELRSQLLPKEAIEYMGNITEWTDDSLFWSQDASRLHFTRSFRPYYYGEGSSFSHSYLLNLNDGDIEYVGNIGGDILNWIGQKIIYGRIAFSSIYDVGSRKRQDLLDTYEAIFSSDGKKMAYIKSNKKEGDPYVLGNTLYVKDKSLNKEHKLLTSDKEERFNDLSWSLDGKKILFNIDRHTYDGNTYVRKLALYSIGIDGSDIKKLADNASSPKWTTIPRITFVSADVARIVILVAIGLTGILLLFCMALIARKTIKAAAPKPKTDRRLDTGSIFCTQCGTQNPESASFCKKCGGKLG